MNQEQINNLQTGDRILERHPQAGDRRVERISRVNGQVTSVSTRGIVTGRQTVIRFKSLRRFDRVSETGQVME